MKKIHKIIILIILAAFSFVPFYPVIVSPEWELQFVNQQGTPLPSVRVTQTWKDYTYEYLNAGGHRKDDLLSDADGYLKLPERKIRVSFFQIVSGKLIDLIMIINPHASSGSHSTVICRGERNCIVFYKQGSETPQRVVIK